MSGFDRVAFILTTIGAAALFLNGIFDADTKLKRAAYLLVSFVMFASLFLFY